MPHARSHAPSVLLPSAATDVGLVRRHAFQSGKRASGAGGAGNAGRGQAEGGDSRLQIGAGSDRAEFGTPARDPLRRPASRGFNVDDQRTRRPAAGLAPHLTDQHDRNPVRTERPRIHGLGQEHHQPRTTQPGLADQDRHDLLGSGQHLLGERDTQRRPSSSGKQRQSDRISAALLTLAQLNQTGAGSQKVHQTGTSLDLRQSHGIGPGIGRLDINGLNHPVQQIIRRVIAQQMTHHPIRHLQHPRQQRPIDIADLHQPTVDQRRTGREPRSYCRVQSADPTQVEHQTDRGLLPRHIVVQVAVTGLESRIETRRDSQHQRRRVERSELEGLHQLRQPRPPVEVHDQIRRQESLDRRRHRAALDTQPTDIQQVPDVPDRRRQSAQRILSARVVCRTLVLDGVHQLDQPRQAVKDRRTLITDGHRGVLRPMRNAQETSGRPRYQPAADNNAGRPLPKWAVIPTPRPPPAAPARRHAMIGEQW